MQRQPKVKLMQKAEQIAIEQTKRESKSLDLSLTARLFLAEPFDVYYSEFLIHLDPSSWL